MSNAWKFFLGLGIVCALVVGSYAYQAWQGAQERAENRYNGFDFARSSNGFWVTRLVIEGQPYDIPFYYHPRETEDVIVHPNVTQPLLDGAPSHVFISIAPDAGPLPVIGGVEIARITGFKYNLLNLPTSSALSAESETEVDVPIITCAEKGGIPNGTVVIQFVHDPEANAIVLDEPCVILFYSEPEDSKRVADRYAYMLLKIMR